MPRHTQCTLSHRPLHELGQRHGTGGVGGVGGPGCGGGVGLGAGECPPPPPHCAEYVAFVMFVTARRARPVQRVVSPLGGLRRDGEDAAAFRMQVSALGGL